MSWSIVAPCIFKLHKPKCLGERPYFPPNGFPLDFDALFRTFTQALRSIIIVHLGNVNSLH